MACCDASVSESEVALAQVTHCVAEVRLESKSLEEVARKFGRIRMKSWLLLQC